MPNSSLLGAVEAHVEGVGSVAQDERGGAAEHDRVPGGRRVDDHAFGLAAEGVVGRVGDPDAAVGGERDGEAREAGVGGCLVVRLGVLEWDRELLGDRDRDRAVDEPAPEGDRAAMDPRAGS